MKICGVYKSYYICEKFDIMSDYYDLSIASLGMAGQLGQAAMSYGTHKADRKFNAEQARLQREFQEKMWNQANEYNLPINQMERFKAAGLNPNLIYGDGATTLAAHIGSAASASAPSDSIKYPDVVAPMLAAVQAKKTMAETDYIEAEELKARQEAKKVTEETENLWIDRLFKRDSYQLRLDQLEAENNLKAQLSATEVSKRNEIEYNCRQLETMADYYSSEMENRKAITSKEIEKMDNDMRNANAITAKTLIKLEADARKANADAWLAETEAAIKSDPRYKEGVLNKLVLEAYNALLNGNEQEIQNSLLELQRANMPKVGTFAQDYMYFWNTWVGTPLRAVGEALGGGVAVTKKL